MVNIFPCRWGWHLCKRQAWLPKGSNPVLSTGTPHRTEVCVFEPKKGRHWLLGLPWHVYSLGLDPVAYRKCDTKKDGGEGRRWVPSLPILPEPGNVVVNINWVFVLSERWTGPIRWLDPVSFTVSLIKKGNPDSKQVGRWGNSVHNTYLFTGFT